MYSFVRASYRKTDTMIEIYETGNGKKDLALEPMENTTIKGASRNVLRENDIQQKKNY